MRGLENCPAAGQQDKPPCPAAGPALSAREHRPGGAESEMKRHFLIGCRKDCVSDPNHLRKDHGTRLPNQLRRI